MQIAGLSTPYQGYALLILSISLANFMAALDATIVSVALPTITDVFAITPGEAGWILTSYILVVAGCVLIFGKISDVIGFKKVFLGGFFIFTFGSFAAGFFPVILDSFPVFIASRIVQAVGASMIMAIGPAMVTAFIPMELKGKAMGTVFTIQAFGGAIGPTIGGFLTQHLSWSWVFFINIPIGFFAIILGTKVIPEITAKKWVPGFDRTGAIVIFVGLASLLFFLSDGQILGWTNPVVLATLLISLISLGFFMYHELSYTNPILELRLFSHRNFILTNLMVVLLFLNFSGIFFLMPFYLQNVLKLPPSLVGLIFSAFPAAIMIGGVISGGLYNLVKGRRLNIIAGVLEVSGFFLITQLRVDTSPWYVVFALLLIGTGTGMILTSASNMIMNSVSKRYQGMISSFTSIERFIPLMMGVAIFNLIFTKGISSPVIHNAITREFLASVTPQNLTAGFNLAFTVAFLVSLIIIGCAILAHLDVHSDYRTGKDT